MTKKKCKRLCEETGIFPSFLMDESKTCFFGALDILLILAMLLDIVQDS